MPSRLRLTRGVAGCRIRIVFLGIGGLLSVRIANNVTPVTFVTLQVATVNIPPMADATYN